MSKTLVASLKSISCCAVLVSILLAGCGNEKTSKNENITRQTDTIRVREAAGYEGFRNTKGPRKRIPYEDAVLAIQLNREFPVLTADSQYVDGFLFDEDDMKEIAALKPAKLFLQIGVTNFADSVALRTLKEKPSYTIIIMPLNADNSKIKDSAGEIITYDFTCPCPSNMSCCPKPDIK